MFLSGEKQINLQFLLLLNNTPSSLPPTPTIFLKNWHGGGAGNFSFLGDGGEGGLNFGGCGGGGGGGEGGHIVYSLSKKYFIFLYITVLLVLWVFY